MLIVSTYAWFTSQKDITLSNLRGTVEVAENMEISLDAANWYQKIDLSNAVAEFEKAQESRDTALGQNDSNRTTALAVVPGEMLPVSGVGELNKAYMPLYQGKATSNSLSNITECSDIEDNGYFAFDIYIKNTSKDSEDDILQLNLNSAVQVLQQSINKMIIENNTTVNRTYVGDADSGLQNTVRVALAMYKNSVSSTSNQKEILEATSGTIDTPTTIEKIAIWEPNASDHVEYIVTNNDKLEKYDTDSNTYKKVEFTETQEVDTYALTEKLKNNGSLDNVWKIDKADLPGQEANSEKQLGLQVTNRTEKINEYNYRINEATPRNLTDTNGADFALKANSITRFRVYIWLEGQDIDCINHASNGGGIEIDLGLTKDNEVGDVLNDVPLAQRINKDNYGDYTNYPVDIDGDNSTNDWRIFYNDGRNVYLIADDYAKTNIANSPIKKAMTLAGMTNGTDSPTYGAYWSSEPTGVEISTGSKFFLGANEIGDASNTAKGYENYKCVSTLLNTEYWKSLVDINTANNTEDDLADSAIGGPTIEMFAASWNEKYAGKL